MSLPNLHARAVRHGTAGTGKATRTGAAMKQLLQT
jgi:hypothetical protein